MESGRSSDGSSPYATTQPAHHRRESVARLPTWVVNETERVETGIQPWHVSMTVPTEHLTEPRTIYRTLEDIGYDRAFSFEAKHDPFVPIAVAGEHTTSIELGTAVAIAFARTPMTLANVGWDLQTVTGGRFTLGSAHRSVRTSSSGSRCHGPAPRNGPKMTEVAGEVADGFLVHPVNTRRSFEQITVPAIERRANRAGRAAADVEIVCVTIVVTGRDEPSSRAAVKLCASSWRSTGPRRPMRRYSNSRDTGTSIRS